MTTNESMPTATLTDEGSASVCTVPEIVELFENVDLKIQALHQCSAEDFLGLNAKFKGFYKESKNVSKDASALLELFSRTKNDQLKNDLELCRTELEQSLVALKGQQSETLRIVRKLNDALEEYLFPLRHINNEFSILNMELIAVDAVYRSVSKENAAYSLRFNALIREWENFVIEIVETKKLSQVFLQELSYSLNHIELIGGRGIRSLVSLLDFVEQGKHLFEVKQRESDENLPELRAKSDTCAKSIADVITSLQYQDIIRQKMEHIQQAHIKLLENLRQTDVLATEDAWTSVLVQVRDISALQAAQLLATNKEYQAAIEAIAFHFRSIAKEMSAVASICRNTMSEDEHIRRTAISDLADRFKRTDSLLARVLDVFPECTREVLFIRDGANTLQKRIDEHLQTFNTLSRRVDELLAPFRDVKEAHFEHYLSQINEMLDTMHHNMETVRVHNQVIVNAVEGLGLYAQKLGESDLLWNYVQVNVRRAHALSEHLLSTEKESNSLLLNIEKTSRSICEETQSALAAVRYYDFFENVIAEIVKGLSSMSSRICANVDLSVHSDMTEVRDLYTMESERKVHDQFTGNTSEAAGEDPAVEDDDDLELF
ncbi:MAG: hypothetical protein ACTTKF_02315 [Bacteroides sp.]